MIEDGFEVGQVVEVQTRFDGRWVRGYMINAVDQAGYWLERVADRSVLPAIFGPYELRAAGVGTPLVGLTSRIG
ncbi:MAG TPA: hypothetical protein VE990_11330 [Acidimicrobiales bacterium]|nr:hypothetical protein [Acidimicrobiales bacterium]